MKRMSEKFHEIPVDRNGKNPFANGKVMGIEYVTFRPARTSMLYGAIQSEIIQKDMRIQELEIRNLVLLSELSGIYIERTKTFRTGNGEKQI